MLSVLLLIPILFTFFIALFLNDKRKLFVSLTFTFIVSTTLLVLFARVGLLLYILTFPIMVILIAIMLLCKGKAVPWICWILSVVLLVVAFFSAWGNSNVVVAHFVSNAYTGGDYFYNITPIIYYNASLKYIIILYLPYIVFIVLMIVASVMRKKYVNTIFSSSSETDSQSGKIVDGYHRRVQHKGCSIVGNVLSGISYSTMLLGVKLIIELSSIGLPIALIAVSLISGLISWLLLKYAMGYGYESGVLGKTAYIWSWIPAIIIIALVVLAVLLMCAFTEAEFSTVANKKVYKVIDENGETRTLDYNGNSIYAKCKDDKGEWWETFDGGSTFRKCDLYKIKDEDGNDKYIRDVGGGGKRIFTDGQGGTYESNDGGITVTERKD